MTPLSRADEDRLDTLMFTYLERKSCTDLHSILCHFELHQNEELRASLDRLIAAGRASYDERRTGYCSRRPPLPVAT